ncbi:MAG: flagellar biosynthesis protein FlhF [Spirochaetes bacterium]|jgi:flagellar biosynthesis protein FlhF|nr:flagellar biosynthesis protein FlhF [Spirochaetota bacterium]
MRYVKIKAKTYNEAMMKLKMEHGDDAIPISHKYVKEGGLFNSKFLARELVELTAAIPERKSGARTKSSPKSTIDFTVGDNDILKKGVRMEAVPQPPVDPVEPPRAPDLSAARFERALSAARAIPEATRPAIASETPETVEIERSELSSLRKLEKEFHELRESLNRMMEAKGDGSEKRSAVSCEEESIMRPFMDVLESNDFGKDECRNIIDEVRNSVSRDDLNDRSKIEKSLRDLLKSRIVTSGPFKKGSRKKVLMFIGPTGVGKTTTMAKLGAIFALREGYRVSFITIDNYRIAATEQLKKYAEIMKIPVHVVNDQKAFKEIIEHEKAEIIMVDTSGRSHRNDLKISEIKSYADTIEYDFEKILCVSANTKKLDLVNIFKSFDKVNFTSVIMTKVDETAFIGNVLDLADKYKKPIAYYTSGQEVPNDIDIADPEKLVNMMIGSINQ